ncbi:putative bifunctional diguanylate cyclase/phosphodiesterase [Lentzea sp. NPDC102401]|uniref:putative bifunctional diguanylate cyclase/phosphodiesterase n=1 Tax=Lentzea sp. NPDC102401 TaxID=3364128 RepID=UPI00381C81DB
MVAGLVRDLCTSVDAGVSPEAAGHAVGVKLISDGYRRPEVVATTIRLLLTGAAGCRDGLAAAVAAGVAEGFATAMRERLLCEQEIVQRAATAAADEAERRRKASDARFQAVFTEAAVGIGIVGLDGVVADMNAPMAAMLGLTPGQAKGRTIADVVGPENLGLAYRRFQTLMNGVESRFRLETRHHKPCGGITHLDLSMSVVRDTAGTPQFMIGVAVDVTQQRQLRDRLWHEARRDALTGLPNRTLLTEYLTSHHAPHVVCYLDLDGFKNINDSLGHNAGDRVLEVVAQRLNAAMTETSGFVARLGGDEFVIVHTVTTDHNTDHVLDGLIAAVERPIRLETSEVRVTCSVGVAHCDVGGGDPQRLLQAADITLYRAKTGGKQRWERYDPDHATAEAARRGLAMALPAALAHREFTLAYQPIVALADGTPVGFEALLRWSHPRLGRVAPGEFIPVAEETGHIVALGRWVLRQACSDAVRWSHMLDGRGYVSVNVAAAQLREPDFTDDVLSALHAAGLPTSALQLELTESAIAGDTPVARQALTDLAGAGVCLSIDDFGTGYSSLSHLATLPVRQLKIDRSLISPVGGDEARSKIVDAVISLAHSLDIAVVAEGVESPAQADHLRAAHCDFAQGWLFGRPAPLEEFLPGGGRTITALGPSTR